MHQLSRIEDVQALVDRLYSDYGCSDAENILLGMKPSPVEEIASLLSSQADRTKVRLAIILGRWRDARAIPALADVLEDHRAPDVRVLTSALRALEAIGGLEALDIVEGYLGSYREEVQSVAGHVSRALRKAMAEQVTEAEAFEQFAVAPERVPALQLHRARYTLQDLCPELVKELVDTEIEKRSPLNRFDLVRIISRQFGRDYLIRVRQFVNRYIYPAAARGRFRIEDDFVFLN